MGRGETVPETAWKPFYSNIVERVKEAQKKHNKVVFTFALFGNFGED